MIRLGITGGIGSGKSYIGHVLQTCFDVPVYDCDANAARIMRSDSNVVERLRLLLDNLYAPNGELDKQRMARYIFASDENACNVNRIVHPAVQKDLQRWFAEQVVPVAAMESAILYESGFDVEVDKVIFVEAPLALRIRRAMERDGATEEQVCQRIARQNTDKVQHRADYRVVNDGIADIPSQLLEILKSLNY